MPKAGKRKRILNPEELIKVWHAAIRQGYPHGTVCQLLMLTGQRESEIANLRRAWINEKEQTITLPDWICKNGKEHTHDVALNAKITVDGKEARLTDLKTGTRIRVTVDDANRATRIQAFLKTEPPQQ